MSSSACRCVRWFFSGFSRFHPTYLTTVYTPSSRNCIFQNTGHLRYLEIKGNGETTSSFAKFEISKLRPANVLIRKSQLFHILGLSGSPFHHVYHIDSDFKCIFPDLKHDFKTFFNNSSDERLCVDIKDRFLTSKFDTGRVKLMFFFCGERIITSTQPSFRHNRV